MSSSVKTIFCPSGNPIVVLEPICSKSSHTGKVRDLKYNSKTRQAFSLSSDGYAKLWDLNTLECTEARSIAMEETTEAVCLGIDYVNNLYAIGSQTHISIIDPRCECPTKVFDSLDSGWGVRSMSINNQIITIGGGMVSSEKYLSNK